MPPDERVRATTLTIGSVLCLCVGDSSRDELAEGNIGWMWVGEGSRSDRFTVRRGDAGQVIWVCDTLGIARQASSAFGWGTKHRITSCELVPVTL